MSSSPDGAAPFEAVFVCTGNRFRSPIAAAAFAAAANGRAVRVRSVGTEEITGAPVLPEAVRLGRAYGLDLSRHRSRALADRELQTADLVVGFEPAHVARAVVDGGARRDRSFLLIELLESLRGAEAPALTDPVERARSLIARANEHRPSSASSLIIPDPLGGDGNFNEAAEAAQVFATRLAMLLFGSDRE